MDERINGWMEASGFLQGLGPAASTSLILLPLACADRSVPPVYVPGKTALAVAGLYFCLGTAGHSAIKL